MSNYYELYTKLKNLNKKEVTCIVGTCTAFDKDTNTITVQLSNGLEMPGVRLKGAVNKSKYFYSVMVPKIKTTVLIGLIGETGFAGEYYLISCDQFEKIEIVSEKNKFAIDKTGISLSQDEGSEVKLKSDGKVFVKVKNFNLHDALVDLCETLESLKIHVNGTAGPYPLTVVAAQTATPDAIKIGNVKSAIKQILSPE